MPIIRWNILTILKFKKEGKKKMSIKIALAGNPTVVRQHFLTD